MRRPRAIALICAVAASAVAGSSALGMPMPGMGMSSPGARTTPVDIEFAAYAPAQVTVLSGDTVMWTDVSRNHTVTSTDESWSSAKLYFGQAFDHTFNTAGTFTYYCRIHSSMHGEVDVYDLLLDPVGAADAPNQPYPLRGRSALAPGSTVTIMGDTGSGPVAVTTTTVADDGTFAATVSPSSSSTYTAIAGTASSPPVLLRVSDRKVTITDVRRGNRDTVTATVTPASPGATVVLQLYLRERFGWWPQLQRRLDRSSRARFTVAGDRSISTRVALTLPDGATVLALSPTVRIGPKHR